MYYSDEYEKWAQEKKNEETAVECATYCIQYNWSVRKIALNMGLTRSTVYRYLTKALKYIDDDLYVQCKHRLRRHKCEQPHSFDGRFLEVG